MIAWHDISPHPDSLVEKLYIMQMDPINLQICNHIFLKDAGTTINKVVAVRNYTWEIWMPGYVPEQEMVWKV